MSILTDEELLALMKNGEELYARIRTEHSLQDGWFIVINCTPGEHYGDFACGATLCEAIIGFDTIYGGDLKWIRHIDYSLELKSHPV